MKPEVCKFFLMTVVTGFLLTCLQSPAFGQCGVPGTPPCRQPGKPPPPVVMLPSKPPTVSQKPPSKGEDISRLKKEDISDSDELVDQFGKINGDDLKARVDNYFVILLNDPNNVGIVVVYGKDRDVASRISSIRKYISQRKFDPKRIEFRRGSSKKETEFLTKLYRRAARSLKREVGAKTYYIKSSGSVPRPGDNRPASS